MELPNQRLCSFGDWVFDSQTGELRRAGQEITHLQRIPGRFLEVLLREAAVDPDDPALRRVLEHQLLKDRVWGVPAVDDRSIHTAVKSVRTALGDRALVQNIAGKGYRYTGPFPRWYDPVPDREAEPEPTRRRGPDAVPDDVPARTIPVLRRPVGLVRFAAVLSILIAVPLSFLVLSPPSTRPSPIVFVAASAFGKPSPTVDVGRDVSELVFARVTQTLSSLSRRRLIEGCDWAALIVPAFPDAMVFATSTGAASGATLAFPLPLPEQHNGADRTRIRVEPPPILKRSDEVRRTVGLAEWLGGAGDDYIRVASCRLTTIGAGGFAVSVSVPGAFGGAATAVRAEGATEHEAIDAAADQLLTRLWPLHAVMIHMNESFEASRTPDCIPLRTQAILSLQDPKPFFDLLLEIERLTNHPSFPIRRFAWEMQGIVYLHGLRDPDRAEVAFGNARLWNERVDADEETASYHQDLLIESALVHWARRNWVECLRSVEDASEVRGVDAAADGSSKWLLHLKALASVRLALDARSQFDKLQWLTQAHAALTECVGRRSRFVSNFHRLALSQISYLLGEAQEAGPQRTQSWHHALELADELVEQYPDDYNLQVWRARLYRLVGRPADVAASTVERFPNHVTLMIEVATAALERGDSVTAAIIAERAGEAFNREVCGLTRKRPSVVREIWPDRSATACKPIFGRLRSASADLGYAAARGPAERSMTKPTILSTDEGLDPEREEIELRVLRARLHWCAGAPEDAELEMADARRAASSSGIAAGMPCEGAVECLSGLTCGPSTMGALSLAR